MAILAGKKVILIGDRDGIPGMAIEACAESAGAEVVFSSTVSISVSGPIQDPKSKERAKTKIKHAYFFITITP